MRIAMIGTGYVGLVSGVCFSDFGHEVVCVDKDPAKLEKLGRGEVPIFEPGLDALMARNVEAGRLSFTGDLKTAVAEAEAVYRADLGLDSSWPRTLATLVRATLVRVRTGSSVLASGCDACSGPGLHRPS